MDQPNTTSTQPMLQVDEAPQSAQLKETVTDNVPVETHNKESESDPDSEDSYNSEDDCLEELAGFKNARGEMKKPVLGPRPNYPRYQQQQATQPTASSSSGANHNPYSAYTANATYANKRFGLVKTPAKGPYKSVGGT